MIPTTERLAPRGGSAGLGGPPSGVVDLWRLRLDLPDSRLAALRACLDPAELERAGRYRRPLDASRFASGRGQLRGVLGGYLGLDASEVAFAYGPYGKPSLAGAAARGLDFNLAHSDGLALLAVTCGTAVGVDIEVPRPGFGGMDIAERFFGAGELRQLRSLPAAEREAGFLRGWTRKEAYVKANGAGLSMALDSFEVSIAERPAPRLPWSRDAAALGRWTLLDLSDPSAGYTAALAVPEPRITVRERGPEEGRSDG